MLNTNDMENLHGKRLLLLGSNLWKDSIKQFAEENGVYLIFAGLYPGALDEIADEHYRIDTTDSSVMIPFIKEHDIDGVFMGGSEFIISKTCDYINQLGYPCYCTKNQWDLMQNKQVFKETCKRYKVPVTPDFGIDDRLKANDFPVIVKPVDGCASRGISVCRTQEELDIAKNKALDESASKRIIIEKFIDNGGLTNVVKYVAIDGQYFLEAMGDRYVLNKGLITASTFFPSRYLDLWMKINHQYVCELLKEGIGMRNGVVAFQTIPDGDSIYVYECCLRLTGGMTYKMTEAIDGHNSLKMLLHHSITGKMCGPEDIGKIDPTFNGRFGSSLAIPLKEGTIASIEGKDLIMQMKSVVGFTQYYELGDSITTKSINTLDQLFARIMVLGSNRKEVVVLLKAIRDTLVVIDSGGQNMILWDTFDRIYSDYLKNEEL